MNKDIFNNSLVKALTTNAVKTATVTSSEVSFADGINSLFIIDMGASADTLSGSVFWTITVEESDTSGSGFTAVTDAEQLKIAIDGVIQDGATNIVVDDPAEDEKIFEIGYYGNAYKGNKKFARIVATATGTHTNGTPISITSIQEGLRIVPTVSKTV